MRDSKALTDLSEDIDTTLSEDQKDAARRLVCANATGDSLAEQVADAVELMCALGLHPSQVFDGEYMTSQIPVSAHLARLRLL